MRADACTCARTRRGERDEGGAAAVEFALVVPFLVLLVFGIISYGYMLSFRQAMSQGAAEGARAAAVAPASYSDADVRTAALNAVNEALGNYGVSCDGTNLRLNGASAGTCGVTVGACVGNTSQQCASVSLSYLYKDHAPIPTFPGVGLVMPTSLSYSSTAEVS